MRFIKEHTSFQMCKVVITITLILLLYSTTALACGEGDGTGPLPSTPLLDFKPGNWTPPPSFFTPAEIPGVVTQPDRYENWGGTPISEEEMRRLDWNRELEKDILTLMEDPVIAGATTVGFVPSILGGPVATKLVTFLTTNIVKKTRIDSNPELKAAYDRIMEKIGPKPKSAFYNQTLMGRAQGRN